jgi:uncharacterized protein YqgC (DUF456 family)
LIKEILAFRKLRNWLIIPLLTIGCIGIILPILPGLLLIFTGLVLWKPELADKIKTELVKLQKKFAF